VAIGYLRGMNALIAACWCCWSRCGQPTIWSLRPPG